MYEIEHNIPIPDKAYKGRTGSAGRFAAINRNIYWDGLNVGDSVFVPLKTLPPGTGAQHVAQVIEIRRRKKGREEYYTYRAATKNGEAGWRIWLTARDGPSQPEDPPQPGPRSMIAHGIENDSEDGFVRCTCGWVGTGIFAHAPLMMKSLKG